jgi:hypothetical protein
MRDKKDRDQMTEGRGRRTGVRGQRIGVKEVGDQMTE